MAPTAYAWRRHLCDAVPNSNPGLAIRTLNIRYRWGFGLEQAIQTVERGFFDIMLLTKTKIQSETYSHNRLVYDVNCLTVRLSSSRGSQGGVELVMRERPVGWGIESMHYHGTNVVSCKIVTGLTRTLIVGAYLPPSTLEQLPELEEAL